MSPLFWFISRLLLSCTLTQILSPIEFIHSRVRSPAAWLNAPRFNKRPLPLYLLACPCSFRLTACPTRAAHENKRSSKLLPSSTMPYLPTIKQMGDHSGPKQSDPATSNTHLTQQCSAPELLWKPELMTAPNFADFHSE